MTETGRKTYESLRKKSALDLSGIVDDLTIPCSCNNECHRKVTKWEVLALRKQYHTKSQGFQQQLQLMQLYRSSIYQEKHGKVTHVLSGKIVCKSFWYSKALRVSRCTYQRTKKMVKTGIYTLYKENRRNSLGERGKVALGFINLYISLHSDQSPDNNGLILAQGTGIKDAYDQYCESYPEHERIQLTYFYKMWNKHYPHVHQRKYTRFTKCHVCLLYKHLITQNISPDMEIRLRKDRDEHLNRQRDERKAYYNRRAEAVMHPNEKLSIILDAMDQSKTNIPHLKGWQTPKTLDAAKLLQTHVVGAIMHGRRTFFFLDVVQWPHDANLTINTLLHAICLEYKENPLPPTLFVQLDNCGRENKNRYFLGTMALLVKLGFFKEIIMSFLMVGHTHEDIDGRFSRVSVGLKKKNAKTLPQLIDVLNTSLKSEDEIRTEMIPGVFNIRDWLLPCLNNIHDHSKPHVYRFFLDKPDHVALKYKAWSTDEQWLPNMNEPQLEIFKIDEATNLQIIPDGIPDIVEPEFDRKQCYNDIKSNITKNQAYLSHEEQKWWEEFFRNPKEQCCEKNDWYFDILIPFQEISSISTNSVGEYNNTSPLSLPMEKERNIPKVHTGKRRKLYDVSTTVETDAVVDENAINNFQIQQGYLIMFRENGEYGIGEVYGIDHKSHSINVNLYQGSVNGAWNPIIVNENIINKIVKKCDVIEDGIFLLTKSKCLPGHIKKKVKDIL